jgi:hypothetical protein
VSLSKKKISISKGWMVLIHSPQPGLPDVTFSYQKSQSQCGDILEGLGWKMEKKYYRAIWNVYGHGHSIYFVVIWYIFFPIWYVVP